jgi:hypothetical protein
MTDYNAAPLAAWERDLLSGVAPKFKGFDLHITLLMAFDLISGIVERFGPDHIAGANGTQGCIYASQNDRTGVLTPVCIVGQMFADLGILRTLVTTSETGGVCNLGGIFNLADDLARFGVTFDTHVLSFLSALQGEQDSGSTWGKALEFASKQMLNTGAFEVPDTRTAAERLSAALDV